MTGGRGGPSGQRLILVDIDAGALLPCGCREEDAVLEQWAVSTTAYNKLRTASAKASWIEVSIQSLSFQRKKGS